MTSIESHVNDRGKIISHLADVEVESDVDRGAAARWETEIWEYGYRHELRVHEGLALDFVRFLIALLGA